MITTEIFLETLSLEQRKALLDYVASRVKLEEKLQATVANWHKFLQQSMEVSELKELRVQLRTLRAILSLMEPLLDKEQLKQWKNILKTAFVELALVREKDVALKSCAKIEVDEISGRSIPILGELLVAKRLTLSSQVVERADSELFEQGLSALKAMLRESLPLEPLPENYGESFMKLRLEKWAGKLLESLNKLKPEQDIQQLHKIRIKVKRLRYILEDLAVSEASLQLLEDLKRLQDNLGIQHDAYVNEQIVLELLTENAGNKELEDEIGFFIVRNRMRMVENRQTLPAIWEQVKLELLGWAL